MGFVPTTRFDRYFADATGHTPFDYQRELAGRDSGRPCESHLIDIPTGLGKTAGTILAWLWNRVELNRTDWPRRLVYCLPMRTLVEQTVGTARNWLNALHASDTVGIYILMGGEKPGEWDLAPEKPIILVGTQDMLMSRALNRGYGLSRYRWPIHFGLLNNDCLWVLDEVQLMGPGLATACQLEAFRQAGRDLAAGVRSYSEGHSVTWYASATANQDHLQTRNWRGIERPSSFRIELSLIEKSATKGAVAERRLATKRVDLQPKTHFGDRKNPPGREVTDKILNEHKKMVSSLRSASAELPRRTLVVCNTVGRAVAVYKALKEVPNAEEIDILLLHSRFRPLERKLQAERLKSSMAKPGGQIVVATQVVEAGVDLSSGILWTEIAPLASVVQRLGRLNRKGEFGYDAKTPCGFTPIAVVVGIAAPDPSQSRNKEERQKRQKEAEAAHLPYQKSKCDDAWSHLPNLNGDFSPAALAQIQPAIAASIDRCPYSLQRHELLDFFDTDSNLSLGFSDVSPFVRGIDPETDLYVAWRDWDGNKPDFPADFQPLELCPVPIARARESQGVSKGWLWRGKEAGWASVQGLDTVPGMTILLPITAGGYSPELGWTGNEKDKTASVYEPADAPSDEELLSSQDNGWRSIASHTAEVESEWEEIVNSLNGAGLTPDEQSAALRAVFWHDTGKNHEAWQRAAKTALAQAQIPIRDLILPIAKFSLSDSPILKELNDDGTPKFTGDSLKRKLHEMRRWFKPAVTHEVASALAFHQSEQSACVSGRPITSFLAEYLIMSHHGRVRKVLRDEIPKQPKTPKDVETVRGVSDGDQLSPVAIDGQLLGCPSLATDYRRMGRDAGGHESYTRGVLRLLDHYGPFRLAFLEALFRAADIRASIHAAEDKSPCNHSR